MEEEKIKKISMMKKNIYVSVLLIIIVFACVACEKDHETDVTPDKGKTTIVFNPNVTYATMTDQDGNLYKTIKIGTQIWMAENLRTKKYNDGTPITKSAPINEGYYNYNNTSDSTFIYTYGRLYNWYAVNTGKLAPKGWHVPSFAEWTTLTTFLGGESISGDKLKEIGTTHWRDSPLLMNIPTNESGFTALPAGGFFADGGYSADLSLAGHWWSITEINTNEAYELVMDNYASFALLENDPKYNAYSVRCVKD